MAGVRHSARTEEGTLQGDIIPTLTKRPGSDIQPSCAIEVIGDGAG